MEDRVVSIVEASKERTSSHQETFQRYILNAAQAVLNRISSSNSNLPQRTYEFALYVLFYSLQAEGIWDVNRQILLLMAPAMELFGYQEDWIDRLKSGVSRSHLEGDLVTEAQLCGILGRSYRLIDQYSMAEMWLKRSLATCESLGDSHGAAVAMNQLGRIYQLQHHEIEATKCAETALSLLEPDDSEVAESYHVLGMVALDNRQWEEAENYINLVLRIRQRMGDQRTIAWAYQNLGLVYLLQSEYSKQSRWLEADAWLRMAVELLIQLSDPYHAALAQSSLGHIRGKLGDRQEALYLYQQAASTLRQMGSQRPLAQVYNNLGLLYLGLERPKDAEHVFRDAVDIYDRLCDHISRMNSRHGIVLALLEQQRFVEATELCERSLEELELLREHPDDYKEKYSWYASSLEKARQGHLPPPDELPSDF